MSHLAFLANRRKKALLEIQEHLRGLDGFKFSPSDEDDSKTILHTSLEAKGEAWEVEVHFPMGFPDEPPKVRVPKAEENYLLKPHILGKGYLCIFDDTTWINAQKPSEVLDEILRSTKDILEGTSEQDFGDEFYGYWWRGKEFSNVRLYALDSPESLKAPFHVCLSDEELVIAQSKDHIETWLKNLKGEKAKINFFGNGVLLKLDKPLLPKEFPKDLSELLEIAGRPNDSRTHEILQNQAALTSSLGFVLISQKTESGLVFGGARFFGAALNRKRELNKGFRPGNTPVSLLIKKGSQSLKKTTFHRHDITRVDHDHIHARGANIGSYKTKRVMLIGCGSLGGYVAHFLSRAGVGSIVLLDNDKLKPENLGRHILGADSWYEFKAEALSQTLQKQMPHLGISGIRYDWREALHRNPNLFEGLDLIIITVGDLRCELPLNELGQVPGFPPIIFGWLEAFAIAGHCLVTVRGSGCRECGIDHEGNWANRVGHFEERTLKKEPGGCTYYQEYGPTALLPVAAMISNQTLKILNNPPKESSLITWISDIDHLRGANAQLHQGWRMKENPYSKIHTQSWQSNLRCNICR